MITNFPNDVKKKTFLTIWKDEGSQVYGSSIEFYRKTEVSVGNPTSAAMSGAGSWQTQSSDGHVALGSAGASR